MSNRDAWFVVGLVLVAVGASFAPKFTGGVIILIAIYLGIGPLHTQFFQG